LVKAARFGASFHSNQSGGILTVQYILWDISFFGQLMLNKATFGLTPAPSFA